MALAMTTAHDERVRGPTGRGAGWGDRRAHRCARAREHAAFPDLELRQLLFKSHRIIYKVAGDEVFILHVRHGRQDSLDEV